MRRDHRLLGSLGLFLSALLFALGAIGLWESALFGAPGGAASLVAQSKPTNQASPYDAVHALPLHVTRQAPSDLEVGGDLAGLPKGATRYVALNDLLKLAQVSYTVSTDPNFARRTTIGGVPLEELLRLLSAAPSAAMILAVCDDKYQAAYPRAYVAAHHPLLVLKVMGALSFASPDYFSAYVRDPKKKNPHAEMPGNPSYDEKTIGALRAYFQTFAPPERP